MVPILDQIETHYRTAALTNDRRQRLSQSVPFIVNTTSSGRFACPLSFSNPHRDAKGFYPYDNGVANREI